MYQSLIIKQQIFPEDLLAIEMKKIKRKKNKPTYLDMSILDISKTLMYEFEFDHIKPKYQNNANACIQTALLFVLKLKIFI